MKKLLLLSLFLFLAPINLALSLFVLTQTSRHLIGSARQADHSYFSPLPPSRQPASSPRLSHLYAALPEAVGEVLGVFTTQDARPIIIEGYLEKYQSPLAPHSQALLEAADKYKVDPWLIVAIAQCESNLCKRSPPGSFNCWGFENGATKFLSWEQALDQVAKTLKENYLDFGLDTPEKMMPKYAPPSVEKGGPWAKCVNQFMKELETGEID